MRPLRLSQAWGHEQVSPHHGRASVEGCNPEGSTTPEPFSPEAIYELKIDTDGDHVADIAYRVRFSSLGNRAQTAAVRRVKGLDAAGTRRR